MVFSPGICQALPLYLLCVFVCCFCQIGWLKKQNFIFSQFWRLETGLAGLVSPKGCFWLAGGHLCHPGVWIDFSKVTVSGLLLQERADGLNKGRIVQSVVKVKLLKKRGCRSIVGSVVPQISCYGQGFVLESKQHGCVTTSLSCGIRTTRRDPTEILEFLLYLSFYFFCPEKRRLRLSYPHGLYHLEAETQLWFHYLFWQYCKDSCVMIAGYKWGFYND